MSKIIRFARVNEVPVTIHFSAAQEKLQPAELECTTLSDADASNIVQQNCEQILQEAHEQAEKMIDQAHQQAETIKLQAVQEGHEQGFQQGYQEGLASGQQQVAAEIEQARQILYTAQTERQQRWESMEAEILTLAVDIAGKVINQQLEARNPVVLSIAKQAIAKVQGQGHITIRVHPADFDLVHMAAEELQILAGSDHPLTVMADLAVQQGGCMVDNEFGSVDARIDSQLEIVKKCLMDVVK